MWIVEFTEMSPSGAGCINLWKWAVESTHDEQSAIARVKELRPDLQKRYGDWSAYQLVSDVVIIAKV